MTPAETTAAQIGHRAFVMLGARDLTQDGNTLRFRVGRNAKRVTHIRVTLDPSDTYTVAFERYSPRTLDVTTLDSTSFVYADQLRSTITAGTGLYTGL